MNYGTAKADDIFESWWLTLQAESDEEEDDDIYNDDKETPVNITSEESAVLPANLPEDARQWLENEDAEADRAMTTIHVHKKKLRKIQPVLDHLNEKFSRLYIPKQNIAIDESLLKWHGRLSFAQKIATKAAKVGVKSYELCESDTGYLWSFFVYTGKGDKSTDGSMNIQDEHEQRETTRQIDEPTTTSASSLPLPPTNATAQIVQGLAKPLLGLGYTLIMDNFYNSPLLTRYLKSQKTDCFGTLRVNREFVPEAIKSIAKTEMRVGEIVQSFSTDVSVILWRDTNLVAMISTFHEGEVGGKEKYGRYKYKPKIVLDYNISIGGVDRKDQFLSAHPIERSKNMTWYKKVFRRLLNVTIHNAFIIFKSQNTNVTNRAFRRRLADQIMEAYLPPRVQCNPVVKTKAIIQGPGGHKRPILQGNHFVGQGASKNTRCVWCKQSRTKYICKQCDVTLCLDVCFEEYHTKY
ncbi:piggyBac transposable element-derived protein 4-like [Cydia pomonella]|uniref:piggyBac transposable element-derived protein 4-like n=1 Tax=Cydia pomonella TaxID=82600 RepID=UPI002ADDA326|nr:piggyBac transposable element-derived protein 4-like [Cydia pomonella]